jgi:hypothetical protein
MARQRHHRSASSLRCLVISPNRRKQLLPATYTIDAASDLVRVECSGVFTNQDLLDCVARLYNDPARTPGMLTLMDCRGVDRMLVTPSGIQAAVMVEVTMVDRRQPPWAMAVVAPQDEMFWMARTYEVLRAGSPESVRVFRQIRAAERWLHSFRSKARRTWPGTALNARRRPGSRGATPPW